VIQVKYNHASNPLRIEFPAEWDSKSVTAVNVEVFDNDGAELVSSTPATLYTATTLAAAAARYASSITLDAGAVDLEQDDQILIAGVTGDEVANVKGYDSATKITELDTTLDNPHDSGDAVYGLFATYTLDTTATATFTRGMELTIRWTPTGAIMPFTQRLQVSVSGVDISGIRKELEYSCHRAYEAFTDEVEHFEWMLRKAERQIKKDLRASNPPMDYDRIVDQDEVIDLVVAKMAYLWTQGGDEAIEDERKFWGSEYGTQLGIVKSLPIWEDKDQDNVKDEGEETSHEPIFDRSW
jgi:hypothetical protein